MIRYRVELALLMDINQFTFTMLQFGADMPENGSTDVELYMIAY